MTFKNNALLELTGERGRQLIRATSTSTTVALNVGAPTA
jgi:hypothetical protein